MLTPMYPDLPIPMRDRIEEPAILTTANHYLTLCPFLGLAQRPIIRDLLRGEEAAHFRAVLAEYAERVRTMPQTYEQDGKGDQAIAYLHYFTVNCDWYITERDSDPDGEGQIQAFGAANLGYGAELGYISLPEILRAGAELDLYFMPKPLTEVLNR